MSCGHARCDNFTERWRQYNVRGIAQQRRFIVIAKWFIGVVIGDGQRRIAHLSPAGEGGESPGPP
jgi:hypothetical protein